MLPGNERPMRFLELGIGTGTLAQHVLEQYPRATITGYDLSSKMLSKAKSKLKFAENRVHLVNQDMSVASFHEKFDVIVSAVAIHHVPSRMKMKLFSRLVQATNPNGIILIGDTFDAPTLPLAETYRKIIAQELKDLGIDTDKYYDFRRRAGRSGGSPAKVSDYQRWLTKAGFMHVDCVWKYYNLAIVHGIAPS